MSLIDLFNPSFLAFLGILVLVAAVLVVYFESKMREQNHKIASMFSIVSTLAEDLNSVKLGINQLAFNGFNGGGPYLAENIQEQSKLIEVSDNENDSDDEDEDDSDNESEENSDDSDSYSNDSDSDSDDSESEHNTVKVLKISDTLPLLEKEEQDFDELEQNLDELEQNLDEEFVDNLEEHLDENLDTEYDAETFEEEPLHLLESKFVSEKIIKNEKSIKIDLGEVVNDIVDYKKLTLQRLKSIVTEKGLAVDTSKLKKPDLLKLLGIE